MADAFDRGETKARSVMLLVERDGDYPAIYGWGEHLGDDGNIAILEKAKVWFVLNQTARHG
jgi:hypothetical protein